MIAESSSKKSSKTLCHAVTTNQFININFLIEGKKLGQNLTCLSNNNHQCLKTILIFDDQVQIKVKFSKSDVQDIKSHFLEG